MPLKHPFWQELILQFRLLDTQGKYQEWSDHSLMNSWLNLKQLETEIVEMQIKAFYQTIAQEIHRKTGQIAEIILNLSQEKKSSVLICCGNLLVVYQLFNFDSIGDLTLTADNLIEYSVSKIKQFF
jgi:hypothetical protein